MIERITSSYVMSDSPPIIILDEDKKFWALIKRAFDLKPVIHYHYLISAVQDHDTPQMFIDFLIENGYLHPHDKNED